MYNDFIHLIILITHKSFLNYVSPGTSLVVQWVRLCTPNVGGPGSIPGQRTKSLRATAKDPAHSNEDPACHK